MEIKFENSPKCVVCKKEINTSKTEGEPFMMERKNGKDKYTHADCYIKIVGREIERVVNLGFVNWECPIDKI